jgi:hypothetical protein
MWKGLALGTIISFIGTLIYVWFVLFRSHSEKGQYAVALSAIAAVTIMYWLSWIAVAVVFAASLYLCKKVT